MMLNMVAWYAAVCFSLFLGGKGVLVDLMMMMEGTERADKSDVPEISNSQLEPPRITRSHVDPADPKISSKARPYWVYPMRNGVRWQDRDTELLTWSFIIK